MKLSAMAVATAMFLVLPAQAAQNLLDPGCESALALSALPAHLRDQASVWSLGENGYRLTRKGEGPFTCIVERNHTRALIPQCVDAAGADTIIPALIHRSERVLAGEAPAEVERDFEARASAGQFHAPPRPGVSYMMSRYNYIYVSRRDEIVKVGPHVMFYAPHLTNADVGGSFDYGHRNRGAPFVVDSGIHAYMISYVENPSESDDVLAACPAEVLAGRDAG